MTILGKASSVRQLSWLILVGIGGVLVLWLHRSNVRMANQVRSTVRGKLGQRDFRAQASRLRLGRIANGFETLPLRKNRCCDELKGTDRSWIARHAECREI